MNIITFKEIDSTQKLAIKMVLDGEIFHKTAIITDRQTNGVGRTGKEWIDGDGNLMTTIIIPTEDRNKSLNSMQVGEIIFQTLSPYCKGHILSIKQPNDILLNQKKICGIIINHESVNSIFYNIIGIGVNIKSSPVITDYPTTSLLEHSIILDKLDIFHAIIERL